MAHQSDGTSTVMLFRDFADYDDSRYRQWHQHIVAMAQQHEGLVDVNLHEPIPGVQAQWIQVITYDSIDHLKALLDDPEYKAALEESEKSFGVPVYQQVVANAKTTPVPVTVVISQVLKPGCEDAYQKWQLEMDAAARKFAGFQGTELIKPVAGIQNEWVVVFRFDSAQHLDGWFASDIHDELMKKAEPYFADVKVRRVGRGFEDWFTSVSGETTNVQAQVKMGMVVLLVLYPLVMLLTLFVTPNVSFWGFAFAMFISNAISVSLLTWPIMPTVSRWLGFWMQEDPPVKTSTTTWGGALIVALYALAVVIFSFWAN
ncbi:MAG: antibiotic biosynthesis monooxygenase [Pseudomonadota bacterium]